MRLKRVVIFAAKVTAAHVVTYFITGAVAYQVLTRQFYEGPNPLFAKFMRTPTEPELWGHVMIWFIPAQILRGVLISAAFYPFVDTLSSWSFWKRFLTISGFYLILGFWAAAVAAPGTIDGCVYMRPEITSYAHLMVQPEIIVQGLLFSAWLARWMVARPQK